MTAKEAISEIKHGVYRNTDNFEIRISKECYKAIIAALEKQIPKKPTDIKSWEFDRQKIGICCICGTGANSDMKYCDNCGQALDWHEELNKNV